MTPVPTEEGRLLPCVLWLCVSALVPVAVHARVFWMFFPQHPVVLTCREISFSLSLSLLFSLSISGFLSLSLSLSLHLFPCYLRALFHSCYSCTLSHWLASASLRYGSLSR
uniref:Uncharacterized protein n=1 Tax=Anopheles darlingi TaxID=43151 RepID=A0A2M4D145_ANODA